MISTRLLEVLMGLIGMHLLVLWPIQHGVRFLQHRDYRQDLSARELSVSFGID